MSWKDELDALFAAHEAESRSADQERERHRREEEEAAAGFAEAVEQVIVPTWEELAEDLARRGFPARAAYVADDGHGYQAVSLEIAAGSSSSAGLKLRHRRGGIYLEQRYRGGEVSSSMLGNPTLTDLHDADYVRELAMDVIRKEFQPR